MTGFTLPTMYQWLRSEKGRQATLHAFLKGHYLGSGRADMVMKKAMLEGKSQFRAIMKFVSSR